MLESFQQVIQQGESVQIMWISEQPSAGKVYLVNCSSAGPTKGVEAPPADGGLRMASWIRHLGIDCFGGFFTGSSSSRISGWFPM